MKALITRPREDASSLARALADRGIDTLIEPLLTIRPAHEGGAHLITLLAGAQAVIFTSANGVRAFAAESPRPDIAAFAVGDATAEAARDAGLTRVESAGGNVADLARLVASRLRPEGGALVHVAGTTVAGDLAGALTSSGFELRRAILYEAVAATALSAAAQAALRQAALDLALFFSPRTATAFVRLAADAGLAETCRRVVAIGLSAAVAAALQELPWRSVRVASAPTQPALLAAVDAVRAAKGGEGREASA